MIFKFIIYILIGVFLGFLNIFGVKYTVAKMINSKNQFIPIVSFFTRMLIFVILFYMLMDGDWKKAVSMLIGITLTKIFIVFYKKNEH